MNSDNYFSCKSQLERKLETTIKERDNEVLKQREKEEEIVDKFKYFSNKICTIMLSNINIAEEYKKSDYFSNIKDSDEIIKIMKKYIRNIERDELLSLLEKVKDFKFDEEIENSIIFETQKSIEIFTKNFKNSKKSEILKNIGEIKTKFEEIFPQEFHINKYEKEINEKIEEFKIENDDIKEINSLVALIMVSKFKELIKTELEYFI